MQKAIVQDRGQITIPKSLRDRLGITPGSVLEFREEGGRLIAEKLESLDPVDQMYGIAGTGRHTDEIMKELRPES